MRKPAFCMCKNKGADQLRSKHVAEQRICFGYIDSTIPLFPKSQISSCGCMWFVLDLVGNPEYRFSFETARIVNLQRRESAIIILNG